MPKIPQPEVRDSDFGDLATVDKEEQMSTETRNPAPSTVSAVTLWGVEWTCAFDGAGRLRNVRIKEHWLDAEDALRDTLVRALERAYAEMPE